MNDFLCSIRLHNIDILTNTFVPLAGYFIFNYLNCKSIESYYKEDIYEKTTIYKKIKFINLLKKITSLLKIEYDEKLFKKILKTYLFKQKIKSFLLISLIIVIHFLFYLPYYVFFIKKFKNKKINFKNIFFIFLLLLLPISLFIIPSWCIFFIPQIINFMALHNLYH